MKKIFFLVFILLIFGLNNTFGNNFTNFSEIKCDENFDKSCNICGEITGIKIGDSLTNLSFNYTPDSNQILFKEEQEQPFIARGVNGLTLKEVTSKYTKNFNSLYNIYEEGYIFYLGKKQEIKKQEETLYFSNIFSEDDFNKKTLGYIYSDTLTHVFNNFGDNEILVNPETKETRQCIRLISSKVNYSFEFQNKILNNILEFSGKELLKTSKGKIYKGKIDKINLSKFDIEKLNKIFNKIILIEEKVKNKILFRNLIKYLKGKVGKEILNKNSENLVGTNTKLEINKNYQEKIEEIIKKYQEKNRNRFSTDYLNSIVIDNNTGNIISLVGNYSILKEEKIGSLMKPLNYALGIEKNNLTRKTKIKDEKTEFKEGVEVNNFDLKFRGEMTIEKALNTSRNIPSVKMYHLGGGKIKLEELLNHFGIQIKKSKGLNLALGETNLNLLKIVNGYRIFSNNGKLGDKQIIKEKTANIVKDILANKGDERPRFWNKFMTVPGKSVSMKTATSIIEHKTKYGRKRISPNNIYMIGFDKKYTVLVWGGNSKGVLLYSANGLEGAGPSMLEIFKILE